MKLFNLEITRLGHDTFRIAGSKVVYIDPFKLSKGDRADIVLISHDHFDHMSIEDLEKVVSTSTTLVASSACEAGVKNLNSKEKRFLDPNSKTTVDGVEIETVPAYNVNKFREPGKPFHPKESKGVGFILKMDGTTVYHTGDADFIPEMKSIRCDVALLPVSGTYVMTAEEAAQAAAAIRPKIAVPMHYGAIVGDDADAKKFKSLVEDCQVEIL